jgi:hypothetical protein
MDTFREDALYLALDKLADINTVAGADFDQCLVPLGIEFGAHILAVEGHLSGYVSALFLDCSLQIGERIEPGVIRNTTQKLVDP